MDAFLQELQTDGQTDSEGEFSISVEAAMRKLRDFQLPRRGSFAAHLVACAVASGASRLLVSASHSSIDFYMDRPYLSSEDLDQLFLAPFRGQAPLFLKELAVGINGAFGLKPIYWRVESWSETQGGWRLHHQNGEQTLTPLHSSWAAKLQGCRVSLFLRPPSARGFNILNDLKPVLTELRDRCAYAPLDLRLGRKRGSQEVVQEGSLIAHALWRTEGGEPGTGLLGSIDGSLEKVHEESFSAYLWIDAKPSERQVHIVVNGISYPPPFQDFLPYPWLKAIIAAPYLEKDLSQASLRGSKEITHIQSWVKQKVPSLLLLRCLSYEPLHRNSLFQFNSCLREVFQETPHPEPVRKWFEMVELLDLAREPSKFESVRKQTLRIDEKCARHVWRSLIRSQTRLLQKAYETRDWTEVLSGVERLITIPDFFARATETEKEVLMTLCCLAGAGEGHPIYAGLKEKADVLWFAPRRALIRALLGHETSILDEVVGLWKHYLSFQLTLPDQAAALEHLKRVRRNHASWSLALNDSAELFRLQGEHRQSLEMRIAFLKSKPASYHHWLQVVASEAQAHGTISQWGYWRARAGLSEVSQVGIQAKSLHLRFANYPQKRWPKLLKESESESLSSPKWQYLFHRALWAVRESGDWETARRYFCRRLLLASLGESGHTLTTPGRVL